MYLHKDKQKFVQLVEATRAATGIDEAIIEKDYFVTTILKRLIEKEPLIIFKGGTCLSKCYKIIDRFSEDIDINLEDVNSQTQSTKKRVSKLIFDIIDELGLTLTNPERIASGRSHNNYKIDYPALFLGNVAPEVQVETMFLVNTFPTDKMEASSIIFDYLIDIGREDIIVQFGLESFEVTTQSLERTFVDKVFALGTHYLSDRTIRQSRHLYDLHKILPHVKVDKEMLNLFDEVRIAWGDRKGNKEWEAAEDVEDLPKLLKEVISTKAYKSDYEKYTSVLLYEGASYDDVIRSFKKIILQLESDMEM